ncbi:MAG: hypothetical protein DI537_10400 [Stutzerimonas stutzeri]|nr:MAG: hypothetical protein DI537_10400 [Stutzerimonas stutzeri]
MLTDRMKLKLASIARSPEHMALYKLTIAGVGFLNARNKRYEFFSHDGDFIGSAPIYRVEPFVAFMKRNFDILRDSFPTEPGEPPALTYGWRDLVDYDTMCSWMAELFAKPITLH